MSGNFSQSQYLIQKKVFKFVGASFKIFDNAENLCFFVNQKGFKLREDIRVYSDETAATELLLIQARKIIEFSAAYDVFDSTTGEKIGALRRKGFKSMIKDEWTILDNQDAEIGMICEDSMALAMLRRMLTSLVPQSFDGLIGGKRVFEFKQKFNPFIQKLVLDFGEDTGNLLDRRMGIAAGVLLCAIEGRQNN
ncbi:MAG TPA: hypothetical protein DD640_01535 [Clostridiales bacterium]|nr:hypothetical protein [Clostridiales bacterium]